MRTSKKYNYTKQWINRVKIISRVLDVVKLNFPATAQFIEDCLEQKCSKVNMSVDEVNFLFTSLEAKCFLFSSAKI